MGGYSSGRKPGFAKRLRVEDVPSLSIALIRRSVIPGRDEFHAPIKVGSHDIGTAWGRVCETYIEARLSVAGTRIVVPTSTSIGWVRRTALPARPMWLFVCASCSKRCIKLYATAERLACRQCHGLIYRSQAERQIWRVSRGFHAVTRKLGAKPAFPPRPPLRPRGMHVATYIRLLTRWGQLERQIRSHLLSKFLSGFGRTE